MLTKLIGEELRSTAKLQLTLLGSALVIIAGLAGLYALRLPLISGFTYIFANLVAFCLPPVMVILLLWRYWTTMYGRQGYLTMLLPVRGRTLYAAKVITIFLAEVIALAVSAVALFALRLLFDVVMGEATAVASVQGLWGTVTQTPETFGVVVVVILCTLIAPIIEVTAVMTIGAEGRFNHLGFGAPVIGLIIVWILFQIVMLVSLFAIPLCFDFTGVNAGSFVVHWQGADLVDALFNGTQVNDSLVSMGVLVTPIVFIAVLWPWAVRSIERHTSLR